MASLNNALITVSGSLKQLSGNGTLEYGAPFQLEQSQSGVTYLKLSISWKVSEYFFKDQQGQWTDYELKNNLVSPDHKQWQNLFFTVYGNEAIAIAEKYRNGDFVQVVLKGELWATQRFDHRTNRSRGSLGGKFTLVNLCASNYDHPEALARARAINAESFAQRQGQPVPAQTQRPAPRPVPAVASGFQQQGGFHPQAGFQQQGGFQQQAGFQRQGGFQQQGSHPAPQPNQPAFTAQPNQGGAQWSTGGFRNQQNSAPQGPTFASQGQPPAGAPTAGPTFANPTGGAVEQQPRVRPPAQFSHPHQPATVQDGATFDEVAAINEQLQQQANQPPADQPQTQSQQPASQPDQKVSGADGFKPNIKYVKG